MSRSFMSRFQPYPAGVGTGNASTEFRFDTESKARDFATTVRQAEGWNVKNVVERGSTVAVSCDGRCSMDMVVAAKRAGASVK